MTSLNLHALAPEELLPLPEIPERYGPQNEEDLAVYAFVKVAIDGPGKKYESVSDFMRVLKTKPFNR